MPKGKKYKILKTIIKFKKVGNNEKTNREQYRQRIIQERTLRTSGGRFIAPARNNMRILSKESMTCQREHIRMLLHTDALHKLEHGRTGQSNFRVRWAVARDFGVARGSISENLIINLKQDLKNKKR
ncbi:hypothetical protein [Campylobacter fetus]|uniref:hypothetical protein n=1 Tax=Campylobacter fetus TaxID=196 RepID=UPI000570249B